MKLNINMFGVGWDGGGGKEIHGCLHDDWKNKIWSEDFIFNQENELIVIVL